MLFDSQLSPLKDFFLSMIPCGHIWKEHGENVPLENPPASLEDPPASLEDPLASLEDPPASLEDPPASLEDPPAFHSVLQLVNAW